MPHPPALVLRRPRVGASSVLFWLMGLLSFALLAYVVFGVARQMIVPPPALRLSVTRDIPLPSGLGVTSAGSRNPLAPGVEVQFDRFDFQAYDPEAHTLFIAHTGPNALKSPAAQADLANDGHVVVFDTLRQQVVARVNIPHIAGLAIAPDLHKVFASDADDSLVWVFDEQTLAPTPILLGPYESPDAIAYDPVDHRIFVSDPGTPANPDQTSNIDRKNQNVIVIDARTDRVVAKINIGNLPKLSAEDAPTSPGTQIPTFGYDIGHNRYDVTQHRIFVTTQILPDGDSPNPNILPPPGTGELMAINPLSAKVVQRVVLPSTCDTPHGLALDTQQEVAFIACVDVGDTPSSGIIPHLVRVDLKTMRVIPSDPRTTMLAATPDIVLVDYTEQVVFVGCRGGISIFDERPGAFHKVGDYQIGKNTHSIALDEATQYLYVPIEAGGRPVLRVVQYNPKGV